MSEGTSKGRTGSACRPIHRSVGLSGLNPESSDTIRTLQAMYEPVLTEWASVLFLVGAFAVLYSTYFVANAAHARVFSDVWECWA